MRALLKPVLGGLFILSVVLLAIMPRLVSSNIQQSAAANLYSLFPPETRNQIEIEELEFVSGWFDSEALYNIGYTTFGAVAPIEMQLRFQFKHGPLLFTERGLKLGLAYADIEPYFDDPQLSQALLDLPFELPELSIDLLIGISQSLELNLDVSEFKISDESASVSFDGLDATLAVASDNSATFSLEMGRLDALGADANTGVSLAALSVTSETEAINDLLANSEAYAQFISIESPGPIPVSAESISAKSRIINQGQDQIDAYQEFVLDGIDSQLPLSEFSWTLELNELQSSVIQQYYEVLNEMQQQLANSGRTGNYDSDLLRDMIDDLGMVLIQNPLVLNNHFTATAYGGEHRLDIELNWLGLPQISAYEELSFAEVIAALELHVDMSLSLEAVLQSPAAQMIDPYAQQGYIALEGDRIEMQLNLSDRRFELNGEVTALEQFFPAAAQ